MPPFPASATQESMPRIPERRSRRRRWPISWSLRQVSSTTVSAAAMAPGISNCSDIAATRHSMIWRSPAQAVSAMWRCARTMRSRSPYSSRMKTAPDRWIRWRQKSVQYRSMTFLLQESSKRTPSRSSILARSTTGLQSPISTFRVQSATGVRCSTSMVSRTR